MEPKDRAEALARVLDGQLRKFQQTRDIEFKVNLALWTAIVIAGGFLYREGLRLETTASRIIYVALALGVYVAHTFLWMFPIQYSEDTDRHYIEQYRRAIHCFCECRVDEPRLTSLRQWYRDQRTNGWTWILFETWLTALLLTILGVILSTEPRRAESPLNKTPQPIVAEAAKSGC
jgi:hypothetical protein